MSDCPFCKAPDIHHSPNQWQECSLKQQIATLKAEKERAEADHAQAIAVNGQMYLLLCELRERFAREPEMQSRKFTDLGMRVVSVITDPNPGYRIQARLAAGEYMASIVKGVINGLYRPDDEVQLAILRQLRRVLKKWEAAKGTDL